MRSEPQGSEEAVPSAWTAFSTRRGHRGECAEEERRRREEGPRAGRRSTPDGIRPVPSVSKRRMAGRPDHRLVRLRWQGGPSGRKEESDQRRPPGSRVAAFARRGRGCGEHGMCGSAGREAARLVLTKEQGGQQRARGSTCCMNPGRRAISSRRWASANTEASRRSVRSRYRCGAPKSSGLQRLENWRSRGGTVLGPSTGPLVSQRVRTLGAPPAQADADESGENVRQAAMSKRGHVLARERVIRDGGFPEI